MRSRTTGRTGASKKSRISSIVSKASSLRSKMMRKTHEIMNMKTGEKLELTADILILLEQLSRDLNLEKLTEK